MKKALFFKTSLLSVSILLLLNGCGKTVKIQPAPEYNGWKLPQDVTMRLGKGVAYDIAYSPDGTQLAVASSIGVWLYDAPTPVWKSPYSRGIRKGHVPSRSHRMELLSLAGF